jgi:hypothetical protein
MIWRNSAGKHGTVSGKSNRHRGNNITEKDTFRGKSVNIRCGIHPATVAAKVIRPAGVNADKDYMANIIGRGTRLMNKKYISRKACNQ